MPHPNIIHDYVQLHTPTDRGAIEQIRASHAMTIHVQLSLLHSQAVHQQQHAITTQAWAKHERLFELTVYRMIVGVDIVAHLCCFICFHPRNSHSCLHFLNLTTSKVDFLKHTSEGRFGGFLIYRAFCFRFENWQNCNNNGAHSSRALRYCPESCDIAWHQNTSWLKLNPSSGTF